MDIKAEIFAQGRYCVFPAKYSNFKNNKYTDSFKSQTVTN